MSIEAMSRREQYTAFKFFQAIPPQIADATVNGATVDLRGFEACTFLLNLGAVSSITSASYWAFRMQHGSASDLGFDGTWSDVDLSHVVMSASAALTSGIVFSVWSDTNFESNAFPVGYVGPRRYVRVVCEEKANLSTAAIGAIALLGYPEQWPVNTPG